ncbi:DUF3080 family protein [Aliiglaciecola aliphaticivorans]
MSTVQLLLLFCCLMLVNACGQHSIQSNFRDYQNQISDEFNIAIQLNTDRVAIRYPSSEDIKVIIPETTIKLSDFYGLKHCSVSLLIAQRNTALGKVQLPSKRFAYEVQLIQGLRDCLQRTHEKDKQQQLRQWIAQKQQMLPLVWAHMVLHSSEIRGSFTTKTELFSQIGQQQLHSYQDSLRLLVALYSPTASDIENLESALNTLRKQSLAAQLWYSQRQLTRWLNDMNKHLQQQFNDVSCTSTATSTQLENLKKLYDDTFIKKIQPTTDRLIDVASLLTPHFKKLQENPILAKPFTDFLGQRELDFEDYIEALRIHKSLWQELFNRC